MRIKKLNSQGVAHLLALMMIIVAVGIGGSYMVFKSHANYTTYTNGRIGIGLSTLAPTPTNDGGFDRRYTYNVDGGAQFEALSNNGTHFAYISTLSAAETKDGKSLARLAIVKEGAQMVDNVPPSTILIDLPYSESIWTVQWSPNDQKIMVLYGGNGITMMNRQVWLVNADGTNGHLAPFSFGSGSGEATSINWSANSDTLIYNKPSSVTYGKDDLCTIKIDGTGKSCVEIAGPALTIWPFGTMQASLDGKLVVFAVMDPYDPAKASSMNLYAVNVDGSNLKKLTNYVDGGKAYGWLVSPDGKSVLYSARTGDQSSLGYYNVNTDGTNTVKNDSLTAANFYGRLTGWQATNPTVVVTTPPPTTTPTPTPPPPAPTYIANCVVNPINVRKSTLATVTYTNPGTAVTKITSLKAVIDYRTVADKTLAYADVTLNPGQSMTVSYPITKNQIVKLSMSGQTQSGNLVSCSRTF